MPARAADGPFPPRSALRASRGPAASRRSSPLVPRGGEQHGRFDEAYYTRFYGDARTRVQGPSEVARLCRGILEVARWWQVPIASVADIGAGTGLARDWFARKKPDVRYVSTDISPFACKAYGHRRLDIGSARLRGRFDLLICQGVLPYLDDAGAARALDHLGEMASGLLYLECQTDRDIAEVVDMAVSDHALRGRPASFYVGGLEKHFVMLGAGLWIARRARVPLYELESGTLVAETKRGRTSGVHRRAVADRGEVG